MTAAAAMADPPIMKNRRRSTAASCDLPLLASALLSDSLLIAISPFGSPSPSLGQREGLGFQFHEDTAGAADGAIEPRRLRHFQIGEHPHRPRLEMPFEKTRLFGELSLEVVACEASHDLEQDSDVIFRFPRASGALDPEPAQILAHPRQRTLVKKAGQIVGGIGQQFAAAEADEKIEE